MESSGGPETRPGHDADVAQLVEQLIRNQQVSSSNLLVGSSSNPEKSGFFYASARVRDVAFLKNAGLAMISELNLVSIGGEIDGHEKEFRTLLECFCGFSCTLELLVGSEQRDVQPERQLKVCGVIRR